MSLWQPLNRLPEDRQMFLRNKIQEKEPDQTAFGNSSIEYDRAKEKISTEFGTMEGRPASGG
jgi:uncharacterized lipoprotein